ncbi:glucose 1-dehydrogenase [Corallococcus sp. BB11-1]|uniref:glucose 1-dehydrogenase n=1 Tax=Corallococcus sp. BB11-1 TaxID=2996783 RepID=UPI0022714469|nr:glucose 1-dehydrogenase [Corallococcus sp. BB11-1]MCY1036586.1 glucose 1-dehydrogenase [Corallococcus sp. BB11-1]
MKRVEGKVALVTGGAGGLGAASARMLAREGARVVVTDRREDEARAVAEELGDAGLFVALDVTQEAQWEHAMARTLEKFGKLDVLVNNAGMGIVKDIETMSLDEWRLVHAVNLDGVFLGCKHGIAAMRKTEAKGSIINISSIAGIVGVGQFPAYSSSKGGVRLLSKSVALHCAAKGYGIRCNSVHPGYVETAMVEALSQASGQAEKTRARMLKGIPLGHFGEPDDVANAVLYLASDESKLMTGAEVILDGGATAQ